MNAYNNITWESDRLAWEEGYSPYGNTLLAILGIPSEPGKGMLSSRHGELDTDSFDTEQDYKD